MLGKTGRGRLVWLVAIINGSNMFSAETQLPISPLDQISPNQQGIEAFLAYVSNSEWSNLYAG